LTYVPVDLIVDGEVAQPAALDCAQLLLEVLQMLHVGNELNVFPVVLLNGLFVAAEIFRFIYDAREAVLAA